MLHDTLREDMKTALKARDEVRLTTLRGLIGACTNELVALKRKPDEKLSDEEVLTVIKRAVKQRKDSIEQFTAGNRPELADQERIELTVLEAYLPAQATEEEVTRAVTEAISENPDITPEKSGMLVGIVMNKLHGNADGALVKKVLAEKLG